MIRRLITGIAAGALMTGAAVAQTNSSSTTMTVAPSSDAAHLTLVADDGPDYVYARDGDYYYRDGHYYYYRNGRYYRDHDPGVRAVRGGATGAALGAAIGCIVTIPIGCAPGAAVGAAVGGGTGAVAGAASTPPPDYPDDR